MSRSETSSVEARQSDHAGTSACQPRSQPFPAAMQANLDGPQRPAERPRRLGLGLSLQVAEDDRLPIFFGKPIDLLVELGVVHDFRPGSRGVAFMRHFGLFAFGGSAPGRLAIGAARHADGDPVQPGAERLGVSNGSGLPRQDEENGLGRILRVVRTAEHVETYAVNDRAVPFDESGESRLGCLVRPGKELLQKLFVSSGYGRGTIAERLVHPRCCRRRIVPFVFILSLWDDLCVSAVPKGFSISAILGILFAGDTNWRNQSARRRSDGWPERSCRTARGEDCPGFPSAI